MKGNLKNILLHSSFSMTENTQIDNKWLKASVLGCLWASSEIVLGSFLHNLRIPFSGSILTGIGIILLISVSYLWKEKGLFWRSGLVCSLMKSVSPSAFIFGPMIAIFIEALLIEFAVRFTGRNMFAYILGGMLAMSWTLFQKIANLIVIYGLNIVELYANLTKFAQKQLNLYSDNIWAPIIALWLVYLLTGLIAALTGIYIGRKALRQPYVPEGIATEKVNEIQSRKHSEPFHHSLFWLAFDVSGMITVLFLMNYTGWEWWSVAGIIILAIWGFRYHRALRPLKKPKFWFIFFVITMLTSFLFTYFRKIPNGLYEGVMTGIQMNLRAAIMIVGFTAIGTELYNPVIRNFFRRTSFRQLLQATEVAFETLPFAIARLPGLKNIFRSPVSILHQLVSQADYWLKKLTLKYREKQTIIILTGGIGRGKSVMLNEIVTFFKRNNIRAGGFISPCVIENDQRTGYDLVNVATGEKTILSRIYGESDTIRVGRFYFSAAGIEFGRNALSPENNKGSQIIVVDEIGPWELENQGWAEGITSLLLNSDIPMIWTVRESIVDKVIENWDLIRYKVFNIASSNSLVITSFITDTLLKKNNI